MGLLDKLRSKGSVYSGTDGQTPQVMQGSLKTSKLHYEYSINRQPNILGKPEPSQLDWDGVTPTIIGKYPYVDNLPE